MCKEAPISKSIVGLLSAFEGQEFEERVLAHRDQLGGELK